MSLLPLYDDGKHQDGAAGDGIFGNAYPAARAGWHIVSVQAQGQTFTREAETLFAVSPGGASFAPASDRDLTAREDAANRELAITSTLDVQRPGRYGLAATLFDGEGTPIARKVMPLDLAVGTHEVTMEFDAWMADTEPTTFQGMVDLQWTLLDLDWAAIPIQTVRRAARIENIGR